VPSRDTRSQAGKPAKGTSQRSNRRSGPRGTPSADRKGRRASEKTEKYRFAQNVGGAGTVAEREYTRYASSALEGGHPDVVLNVPVVKVDRIHLEVEELNAHVALQADVLDLVHLSVGVALHLGKVRLELKGVEAQALLRVRLDNVAMIVDRVLTTLDRNPAVVRSLGRTVEEVGVGAGHVLTKAGEALEHLGSGAAHALAEIGSGAGGEAVGQLGKGAGRGVGQLAGTPHDRGRRHGARNRPRARNYTHLAPPATRPPNTPGAAQAA
jgi:hypothetical protein